MEDNQENRCTQWNPKGIVVFTSAFHLFSARARQIRSTSFQFSHDLFLHYSPLTRKPSKLSLPFRFRYTFHTPRTTHPPNHIEKVKILSHLRSAGAVELLRHLFFSLAPEGCEWSVLCPSYFPLWRYPLYPLNSRMGGPQTWCERCVGEKNPFALLGIELLTV